MVAAQNIGHADASDQKQWTLMWREDGGLMPSRAVPDAALLAADSWLVDDGRVRGLDHHRRRFVAACVEASGDSPARIESFWRDVIAALPRTERWFPRVELAGPEAGPAVPADTPGAAADGQGDRMPDRGVRSAVASPP